MRREAVRQNPRGNMMVAEIPPIMQRYGIRVRSYTNNDAQAAVDQLKHGRQGFALGQTGILGPEDAPAGYAHFVYIRGYDGATGRFAVADPLNSDHRVVQMDENTLRWFVYSSLWVNPTEDVLTF